MSRNGSNLVGHWRSSCQIFSLLCVFVYNNYVQLSFLSQSGILGRVFTAHCSFLLMLGWLLSCPQDWHGAVSLFYQSGPLATETSAHILLFSVWAEFKNVPGARLCNLSHPLSPLVFWCVCLVWALGLPPQLKTQQKQGGHGYTDPSAVAQLEQCKFIKENKRRKSKPASVLRGFQHAPRVMSWK